MSEYFMIVTPELAHLALPNAPFGMTFCEPKGLHPDFTLVEIVQPHQATRRDRPLCPECVAQERAATSEQ